MSDQTATPGLADELIAAEAGLDAFHAWCSDWEEPLTRQDDAVLTRARTAMSAAAVAVRERDVLEQWKLEATAVIERWERVYEAVGSPGGLGQFRSDLVLAEVSLMQAERDVLAADLAHMTGKAENARADANTLVARVEQLEAAIGDPDELRWHRWHCDETGNGDDLRELLVRIADALEAVPVPEPRPEPT